MRWRLDVRWWFHGFVVFLNEVYHRTFENQPAAECARALDFWATVLDMEWHEDDSRSCAIQIVDGRRDLFIPGQLARSQLPERFGFQGWIAFNPRSSLPANEQFFVAVHELGHVLGLPHNSSASSIMFYLNVDEPFVLDSADLRALAARHKLRVDRLDQPLMVTPRAVPAVDPRAGRQLNAGPAFAAAAMHLQGVLSYERRSYDVSSRDSLCRSASLLLGSAAQSQTAGRDRIIVLIGPTGGGKSSRRSS